MSVALTLARLKAKLLGSKTSLEKLRIEAIGVVGKTPSPFEAQFNPTSYKHSYRNQYQRIQAINTVGAAPNFLLNSPEELSLTLILQQTMDRMSSRALLGLGSVDKPVYDRVQDFLLLAQYMDAELHAPHNLRVSWGTLNFECVLTSANINYAAFDQDGEPIRAEIDVSFRGILKDPLASRKKHSPDLTHARSMKDWQTLPMLSEQIYGDPHLNVLIAEANGIDHFRRIPPGTKVYFPPTVKDESSAD